MSKSGIHIDPSKKGSFTRSAKSGESTQQHATRVLNDPHASASQKKKANFARNSKSWRHGGRKKSRSKRR